MAMSAALIGICSLISIPMPPPFAPFTLQTFAVFFSVGLLGTKNGTAAVFLWIILGCMGVPVFSGFRGGFAVLLGPSGGFLPGFLAGASVCGFLLSRCGRRKTAAAAAYGAGLLLCYGFGTAWFMLLSARAAESVRFGTALLWCVVPYILPDAGKLILAAWLSDRIRKYLRLF